jgi:hypothetical protein
MKKDFLVVILIVGIVFGGGYLVHTHTNIAYSSGTSVEKDKKINVADATEKVMSINKLGDEYLEDVKKEEEYTLEEVYNSILSKDEEANGVSNELVNIYNDFYKYFSYYDNFINVLDEKYTYYEYNLIKNNYNLDKNFGLYIVHTGKCDVFKTILNSTNYC